MKTDKTVRCTFSEDGVLDLHAPKDWTELDDDQFRYAMHLLGCIKEPVEVKTRLFFYLCDITVDKYLHNGVRCSMVQDGKIKQFNLSTEQVHAMIHEFDFVDDFDTKGRRLEYVAKCFPVDKDFHGVKFSDYINVEVIYQSFLRTKHPELLDGMFKYMYQTGAKTTPRKFVLTQAERMNCFCWFVHIKNNFSKVFPHFFRPVNSEALPNMRKVIDAQIRALTKGDIVKEELVLQQDCWRALTELDALAQEAEEFERKYGKH